MMDELLLSNDNKIIFLILDGLGDIPNPGFDLKTPLQAASKPNMDGLAMQRGVLGRITPVGTGITPGSGPGHLSLFGYDPVANEIGRGVLEVLGLNMDLRDGDLAARAKWEEYQAAYEDALSRCSTDHAPWHIIPADKKWYRNLAISQVLEEKLAALKIKDIVIDAGNANFRDTIRRFEELEGSGLTFIGMGVSGGAEGARHGPSIMVGGRQRAVNIYIDTDKLTSRNLSIEEVRQALVRQNLELPGGRVDQGIETLFHGGEAAVVHLEQLDGLVEGRDLEVARGEALRRGCITGRDPPVGVRLARVGMVVIGAEPGGEPVGEVELAQFRAMEAFAQFASDLDAATQQQLSRGARLVELLKQGQYQPLPVQEQIVQIYAGTHGYLDPIPANEVPRFVTELIVYVRSNKPEILENIVKSGKIDDATEAALNEALKAFSASFEVGKK